MVEFCESGKEGTPLIGTLGPAYNEFGYNEHPAIASNFFL